MWYVLGEIWLWMILALILGIVIGSVLGQLRRSAGPTDTLEADLAAVRAKLRTSEATLAEALATTPVAALAAAPSTAGAALLDPDDLKLISGVGPKLEEVLHANGVLTFKQIADLDDAGVDALDALLGDFQGRIARDGWVQQAAELHAAKSGS